MRARERDWRELKRLWETLRHVHDRKTHNSETERLCKGDAVRERLWETLRHVYDRKMNWCLSSTARNFTKPIVAIRAQRQMAGEEGLASSW